MNGIGLLFLVLVFFALRAEAVVDDGSVVHTGEATYYSDTTFGNCGFPPAQQHYYHGAMNHEDYDTAAPCGAWVHITGPSGEVTAFIDDQCPECRKGDIDLGPRTFAVIGDLKAGRIPISWRYVEGEVTGPIQYFWKDGSSQWHIELQVRNFRYAIVKVEICIPPGEWINMPRQTYNFFVLASGVNAQPGPYALRVTDIFGQQLVDSNITLTAEQVVDGKANFPERAAQVISQSRRGNKNGLAQSAFRMVLIGGGFPSHGFSHQSSVELFSLSGKSMGVFTVRELASKRLKAVMTSQGVVVVGAKTVLR